MDHAKLIAKIQREISSGISLESKKALYGLDFEEIDRKHRLELAKLCGLVNYHFLGFKILSPVVVGDSQRPRGDANDQEELEYCRLLRRLGASNEAIARLKKIDFDRYPSAMLELAYCYFTRWNYSEAITWLTGALGADGLTAHQQGLASVHLMKAYVGELSLFEAREHGETVLATISNAETESLKSIYYASLAELNIFEGDLEMAQQFLEIGKKYLHSPFGYDSIEIDKWLTPIIAGAGLDEDTVMEFQSRAIALQKYDALRDFDLMRLKICPDDDLKNQLIYGTPFESYHHRVSTVLGDTLNLPDQARFGDQEQPALNLYLGEMGGHPLFNAGKNVHRLIYCLASDQYRPWNLGAINQSLFPDELFNIYSVPNRIHQLVHRARREIKKQELQMEITERHNVYSIDFSRQPRWLDKTKRLPDANEILLMKVKDHYGFETFTSLAVTEYFQLSKSASQRFLLWGVKEGLILNSKQGRQVFYQVADTNSVDKVA